MKRLLCMISILALVLGLVGCGNGEDVPSVPEQDKTLTPSASEQTGADIYTNTIPAEVKGQALTLPAASYESLPAWRGLEYEIMGDYPDGYIFYGFDKGQFAEQDIKNMADLGFNFVRVPVNTRFFYTRADVESVNMENWINLDQLITWGIQYGVHISVVVCETYGYNCTYSEEMGTLFKYENYMEVFLTFWETLAQRYSDIPNNALSFNILNEPCDWIGEERYCELVLDVAERIRAYSPERLIISDMYAWGQEPIYGLVDANIVQSIHCYAPDIFHNTPGDDPSATWPMYTEDDDVYGQNWLDQEWLREYFQKYADFEKETGVTIFINEFGVPVTANYEATLDYIDDLLTVITENGWCWAMYDYIGPFCLVQGNNEEHIRVGADYVKMGDCMVDAGLYEVLSKY